MQVKNQINYGRPLFLTGGAFAVFQGLRQSSQTKYDEMKKALLSAFSMRRFQTYETFVARRVRVGESVDVYLADLSRIASMMSPNPGEEWLTCAFVCGLPTEMKSQLQATCSLAKMKLHEIVEKARGLAAVVTEEACFASAIKAVNRGDGGARGPIRCFQCGGLGHIARECPGGVKRKRDNRSGGNKRVC